VEALQSQLEAVKQREVAGEARQEAARQSAEEATTPHSGCIVLGPGANLTTESTPDLNADFSQPDHEAGPGDRQRRRRER